jgi:hypothetical protein
MPISRQSRKLARHTPDEERTGAVNRSATHPAVLDAIRK